MKLIPSTAVLVVLGSLAGAAQGQAGYGAQSQPAQAASQSQPQQAAPKLTLSKQAIPALADLQKAVNANDVANIPAKIAAAQAVVQNKDDRFLLGQLQLKAALASKDLSALSAAVETLAGSQYLDSSKVSGLYKDLGVQQFNAKQYAPAIASFQKAAGLTPNDPETLELIGQGMLAGGRAGDSVPVFQRALQARTAAGQKPSEDIYRKAVQAAFDAKSPAVIDLARQWLVAYPSPNAWRNTLAIYSKSTTVDPDSDLALLRLMLATGAMTNAGDYRAYVNIALLQSNFNEAHAALDAGIAAKAIDPASADNSALVASVRAKPTASVADLIAAAKTAQSGMALLRIGDRLYGLGEYAKAAELYRQAQAKGVDAETANLHLGMALARSGDKAGATAAFNAVTGPRVAIAKYWLLYLQQHG